MKVTVQAALMSMLLFASCKGDKHTFDASGSFEAEETIISSEATGKLMAFSVEEGQVLQAGTSIGYIDSTQLFLKKQQLELQVYAVLGRKPQISVQLAALQQQLKSAEKERERFANLVKADAATQKQLDDIDAQIDVLKAQVQAQKSSLSISSEGFNKDAAPLQAQILQLNDQLEKCKLINPVSGTVLTKYAEVNEMTAQGKALYKIADLSEIILRTYITGNQLPTVKQGQKVTVSTDDGKGGFTTKEGTVTWISDKAEFTPKTIQTKDERANMVYAMKIKVKNDGTYKIGMYGEIKFQ